MAVLSLANMLGRIGWSSTSDLLGRKMMYRVYLGVGALLYLAIVLAENGNQVVFLLCAMLILSFYGADQRKAAGISGPDLYQLSFMIMIGLLVVGLVCNELIKPVHSRFHEPGPELAEARSGGGES